LTPKRITAADISIKNVFFKVFSIKMFVVENRAIEGFS